MSYKIEAASKEEWAERALSSEKKLTDLQDNVRELFSLLDTVEETEHGDKFRPTVIRSCRTQHTMQLETILAELKELCNETV